jgi:hypothetical protein
MITRDEFLRRSAMAGATLGLAPEALGARMSQTDRSTLIVAAADTPQILDMQKTVHPPSEEVVVGGTNDVLQRTRNLLLQHTEHEAKGH